MEIWDGDTGEPETFPPDEGRLEIIIHPD